MKKIIIILVLIFVGLQFLDLTVENNTSLEVSFNDSKSYGNKPAINNWPNSEISDVIISDNLLAANYYLVLDGSGSMNESYCSGGTTKMQAAKKAFSEFAKLIPVDANIGLFVFDTYGVSERVKLGPNNQQNINVAISRVVADEGTPLETAITSGYEALEAQALKQLGYGEYHLVVITDGEANSTEDPSNIVDTILSESPVVLHTIGFCISGSHSLNQAGRVNYKQANDRASLRQGLQDVLAESATFLVDEFNG